METKFNFKSAICTSREQSERLLALGLKKETADMKWLGCSDENGDIYYMLSDVPHYFRSTDIPAWSLGRLIEVLKRGCDIGDWNYMELSYNHPMEDLLGRIETIIISNNFNKKYLV